MSLFHWGSQHEVFLSEVDAEHRGLFLAAEKLHCVLDAGAGHGRIAECLHNLLQLTEAHFLHEERMMRDAGFDARQWHSSQHDAVRKRGHALDPGNPEEVSRFLQFLAEWFRDHTSVADRMMAAYLRNWSRRRAA